MQFAISNYAICIKQTWKILFAKRHNADKTNQKISLLTKIVLLSKFFIKKLFFL